MAAYSQSSLIDAHVRCDYLALTGNILYHGYIFKGAPGWNGGADQLQRWARDILDDCMTRKQRVVTRDVIREFNAFCRRENIDQFDPTNDLLDDIISSMPGPHRPDRSELRRELVR